MKYKSAKSRRAVARPEVVKAEALCAKMRLHSWACARAGLHICFFPGALLSMRRIKHRNCAPELCVGWRPDLRDRQKDRERGRRKRWETRDGKSAPFFLLVAFATAARHPISASRAFATHAALCETPVSPERAPAGRREESDKKEERAGFLICPPSHPFLLLLSSRVYRGNAHRRGKGGHNAAVGLRRRTAARRRG